VRVLVTGATGLIGSEVLALLRRRGAPPGPSPGMRAVGVARREPVGTGDAVRWDMASEAPPEELRREWDVIVNAAADTRWTQSASEAERANVATVSAIAPLVSGSTRVVHVSTAYALGLRGDAASPDPADYRNHYEWSKAASERRARELFRAPAIVRPSLVIGRRDDGAAARFSGMYLFLRGITAGTIPAVVGTPDAFLDVVPVDAVAEVIVELALEEDAAGDGVVTVAAGAGAPRVQEGLRSMVTALNHWRSERSLPAIASPPVLAPERWERFFLPFARTHLSPRQLRILELLANFAPYLQITEPLQPTHPVPEAAAAIEPAVRYWAETHPRLAALQPRPWGEAIR